MENTKWVPITRGKPDPIGVDEKYRGLLDVEIELSATPPPEWAESFLHPVKVPISMSMHPPRLEGSTVIIKSPDNDLAAYVQHVDVRIAHANQGYEHKFLPAIDAARERDQRGHDEEQRRLAAARKRAETL